MWTYGGGTASLRLPSLLLGGNEAPIGVPAAVNHSNPAKRVSVQEGLEPYTINAARIAFQEVDNAATSKTHKE